MIKQISVLFNFCDDIIKFDNDRGELSKNNEQIILQSSSVSERPLSINRGPLRISKMP